MPVQSVVSPAVSPRRLGMACLLVVALAPSALAQPVEDRFAPEANQLPETIAVQSDGKVLVGGQFTTLDGVTRHRLARLQPNGQLDVAFNPGANATVHALAVLPDGKILVGGAFTQLDGRSRTGLGRLHGDGRLDTTFPDIAAGAVLAIVVQPDARILIAGTFATVAGQPRPYVARLWPDGRLDTTFIPRPNNLVYDLALQRDGRILLAGGYTAIDGVPRGRLARLLPDGALDDLFRADADREVFTVAVQDDGRILVGGRFDTLAGQARAHLGRLEADGRVDMAFTAGTDDSVAALGVQDDGRILVGGAFTSLAGAPRRRVGRLLASGALDSTFVADADGLVNTLGLQPDGAAVIGGAFTDVAGRSRTRLARITRHGLLDATMRASISVPGQEVLATAMQADGRLLVGGWFIGIVDGTAVSGRPRLARFLPDGSLDDTFAVILDGPVYAVAVQEDGGVLIGGAFLRVNGELRARLVRLQPSGAIDTTFADASISDAVYAIALQADGRILVGGAFESVGTLQRAHLARLQADGTVDASFDPGVQDGAVYSIAIDAADRILAGGPFEQVQGQRRPGLRRWLADGRLDESFLPAVAGAIRTVVVDRDGRILVGGSLTLPTGESAGTARLDGDGSLDPSFTPLEGTTYTIAPHANGRITVGGSFSRIRNATRDNLARVREDGALDGTFTVGTGQSQPVHGIVLDAHGKLAVGGLFTTLGGEPRQNLGRAAGFVAPTGSLRVRADGTRIDWLRGGGGPELFHVSVDVSTDGIAWTTLGRARPRPGGWTLDGLALPFDTRLLVRARGRHSSGYGNGSISAVEVVRTAFLQADPDKDGLPTAWELRFGTDAEGYDRDGDNDGDGVSNALELQSGSHPLGTFVRYLAEGATSDFFRTRLALLNPGTTPASIVLRFLRSDGTTAHHDLWLDALTRATVDVGSLPGLAGTPAFATILEADTDVVLDRTMQWDASGYGSHAETAIERPGTRWYLAEGATHSGFSLFYLLQNPNPVPAEVRVTYLLPQGPPLVRQYVVEATSRLNVWVNQIPELASTDVSAVIEVTNGRPIVVERAMYLSRNGRVFDAGHASAGVPTPSASWFLAEGATGPYFDLFVLLANPDPSATALVDVTYLRPDGSIRTKRYPVAPQSRFTIWVDEEVFPGEGKAMADTAVSLSVSSFNGVPIVVERAMWWPGPSSTWHEAHNSAGTVATGRTWALADGEDGGAANAETYILIANVSSASGTARVTLAFEDGSTATRTFALAPTSRFNVNVRASFPEATGRRFGAIVESVGTGVPLVVERAMYADSEGVRWAAGTNATGTILQ